MMARKSASKTSSCSSFAAACSSARIRPILDTALLLVVSICILCLRISAAIA